MPHELRVSIHAPAWGATPQPTSHWLRPRFQSTHPRGVRQPTTERCTLGWLFQSTHPRGVRHCAIRAIPRSLLFQSTHPRGVRRQLSQPRGNVFQRFNPRTRVGCDIAAKTFSSGFKGFNPRTRVGCDRPELILIRPLCLFQSTHPRGVRPILHVFKT